jgi:hypothetical protein
MTTSKGFWAHIEWFVQYKTLFVKEILYTCPFLIAPLFGSFHVVQDLLTFPDHPCLKVGFMLIDH